LLTLEAGGLRFEGECPPWWLIESHVESCRALRAVAIESGLDPDKTAPEDILLLERNKDGGLAIHAKAESAQKRASYYIKRMQAGLPT
jgi:hypothetical protein